MREGNDHVYVIEVNPRASRTVPYVSKATGIPLAKIAARLMTGRTLRELLPEQLASARIWKPGRTYYVKSPVFPWSKFAGVDTVLGPEMKSTGEVMGVAATFGEAFAKAQLSAGQVLPTQRHGLLQRERSRQAGCGRAGAPLRASRLSAWWRPRARRTCWSAPG